MMEEPKQLSPIERARAAKVAKQAERAAQAEREATERAAANAAKGELDPYEGITTTECPIECDVNRCVITGENICGHPHKGGLQAKYQAQPECIERYRQARIRLARQRVKEM